MANVNNKNFPTYGLYGTTILVQYRYRIVFENHLEGKIKKKNNEKPQGLQRGKEKKTRKKWMKMDDEISWKAKFLEYQVVQLKHESADLILILFLWILRHLLAQKLDLIYHFRFRPIHGQLRL